MMPVEARSADVKGMGMWMEERARFVDQRSVDPCQWQAWYCTRKNVAAKSIYPPMCIYRLPASPTLIIVGVGASTRLYVSVERFPWQAITNRYNTGNSFFERPFPVYVSSQNAWRKSGGFVCCFTRILAGSFKQSSLPHSNKLTKTPIPAKSKISVYLGWNHLMIVIGFLYAKFNRM